jgi:hypothetical protein
MFTLSDWQLGGCGLTELMLFCLLIVWVHAMQCQNWLALDAWLKLATTVPPAAEQVVPPWARGHAAVWYLTLEHEAESGRGGTTWWHESTQEDGNTTTGTEPHGVTRACHRDEAGPKVTQGIDSSSYCT